MSANKSSKAYEAVMHIVRRVQSDASFAWLMIGTESLALCFEAIAERTGDTEDSVRKKIEENAETTRETPEIVLLRRRVESLDKVVNVAVKEPSRAVGSFDALSAIESLLWQAKCGHDVLTLENVEAALDAGAGKKEGVQ